MQGLRKKEIGSQRERRVYKPERHVFAVRRNPDDLQERTCLEDSVTEVLEWFKRWLCGSRRMGHRNLG